MEQQAFSIPEFCDAHGVSRSFYFLLRKDGRGPRELRVGRRVLITRDAAAEWRAAHERQAA